MFLHCLQTYGQSQILGLYYDFSYICVRHQGVFNFITIVFSVKNVGTNLFSSCKDYRKTLYYAENSLKRIPQYNQPSQSINLILTVLN